MVEEIKIGSFDYNLPDERIPRHPLAQRDACRLLLSRPDGRISHRVFSDLPNLLPPSSMLVCNDTRVINARMAFRKPSGSRIEIFLLEPVEPADYVLTFQTRGRCIWSCLVGNLKRWKSGSLSLEIRPEGFTIPFTLTATRLNPTGGNAHAIEFTWDNPEATFASVVEAAGNIPVPPYLKRDSEESDLSDYQTVYADAKGSVAAPTAGLHFTPDIFRDLEAHNIEVGKLTLHVGAGTFQPVKSEMIGDHPMHTETFTVSRSLLSRLIRQKESGLTLTAVGTTSVRTLESLPVLGHLVASGKTDLHVGQWDAYSPDILRSDTVTSLRALLDYMESNRLDSLTASTAIMIAPGFRWRMTDAMVTNFHQPQSTLLLLVSSFLGSLDYSGPSPRWRRIYDEALSTGYRFLSYGDACLFFRPAVVTLPPSKSIGARVLTASCLAGDSGVREDVSWKGRCDDFRVIDDAIHALAENVRSGEGRCAQIDLGASGTALRFMTAAAASTPGAGCELTGSRRLFRRPLLPLVELLRNAGAEITLSDTSVHISGRRLRGGDYGIAGDISSQFISAIMLAAPAWDGRTVLRFTTPLVSRPYVEMTARVMESFGIVPHLAEDEVVIDSGVYRLPERNAEIEGDWSAAAFFYEGVMLGSTPLRLERLLPPEESMQGDSAAAAIFGALGVSSLFTPYGVEICRVGKSAESLEADLSATPDLVPPLVCGCALSGVRFRFTGVRNLRFKESDRLEALRAGLSLFGIEVRVGEDEIEYDGEGSRSLHSPAMAIDSCGDHRIAMSFAMAALRVGKVEIADADAVGKSYPEFWEQLARTGLKCRREGGKMVVES